MNLRKAETAIQLKKTLFYWKKPYHPEPDLSSYFLHETKAETYQRLINAFYPFCLKRCP